MKLELNHLAPYLPYGLKLKINTPIGTFDRNFELDCGHDFNLHLSQGNVKPILRPISDLHCDFEINDCNVYKSLSAQSRSDLNYITSTFTKWSYEDVLILAKNYFDIFGLIPAGLAISIHDVGQVVA